MGTALAFDVQVGRGVLELRRGARQARAALLPSVPRGVHAGVAGEDEREGGAMKWVPDQDRDPKNWARGEHGKWKLMRPKTTAGWSNYQEHLASVERAPAMDMLKEPTAYMASVSSGKMGRFYLDPAVMRQAPALFPTLREAQLWCEREVRFMEIGELA